MNQLRHLAIRTEEPEKLAAFYIEAFGFRDVKEGWPPAKGHERRSFHLTDGYFELAILANAPNQSPNGLYHFGIKVDDILSSRAPSPSVPQARRADFNAGTAPACISRR